MVVIGVCSYHLPSEITLSEAVRLFVPSGIIFLLIKKKKKFRCGIRSYHSRVFKETTFNQSERKE